MTRRHFAAIFALTASAKGSPAERSRVLYASSAELSGLAHEELGRVDSAIWFAASDPTIRALARKTKPLFLYFDRGDYNRAVAGLSRVEIDQLIRHRRTQWAPESMRYAMYWLFQQAAPALEFDRLQRLAGLDRYAMSTPKNTAFIVLEGEAMLLAILRSAIAHGLPVQAHLAARTAWARVVGEAAGHPGSLPHAEPSRGVFLHPLDESSRRTMARTGFTAVPWRDGAVCAMSEDRMQLPGKQTKILYASAAEFLDDAETLTRPQLHRDFVKRFAASPAERGKDMLAEIDRLHLHQILMKRELLRQRDAPSAAKSPSFWRMLEQEINALRESLRDTGAFGKPTDIRSDLQLFAELADRYWPTLASKFREAGA